MSFHRNPLPPLNRRDALIDVCDLQQTKGIFVVLRCSRDAYPVLIEGSLVKGHPAPEDRIQQKTW